MVSRIPRKSVRVSPGLDDSSGSMSFSAEIPACAGPNRLGLIILDLVTDPLRFKFDIGARFTWVLCLWAVPAMSPWELYFGPLHMFSMKGVGSSFFDEWLRVFVDVLWWRISIFGTVAGPQILISWRSSLNVWFPLFFLFMDPIFWTIILWI